MSEVELKALTTGQGLVGGPFGSDLISADYVNEGIPIIRGNNMNSRLLGGDFTFVTPEKFARDLSRNSALPGDLIFTQRGTLGQVSIVPEGPYAEYVVSQSQMRLRVDSTKSTSAFVYYACRDPRFLLQLHDSAIRTGVPHINLGILSRLTIPMLPRKAQHSIANVLGALDDKICANERIRVAALELARKTFDRSIRTTPLQHMTLGDFRAQFWLRFSDGYRTKASEYGLPGMRILRAGDVKPDRIAPEGQDYVSDHYSDIIGVKASQPGDVVVTTKGTVGRVAVIPDEIEQVVYSPQLCFFRVLDTAKLSRGFISGWFRSADFTRQAEMRMFKSDMAPYINLKDIQSMTVPIPISITDQHRIGEVQAALEHSTHSIDRENRILTTTRDELLPLLMSGKIRVRDAEKVVEEVV